MSGHCSICGETGGCDCLTPPSPEDWLARVLRENKRRFKRLPKAIRDARFSHKGDRG